MSRIQRLSPTCTFEDSQAVLEEVGAEMGIQNPGATWVIRELGASLYQISWAWEDRDLDLRGGALPKPMWLVSDDVEEVHEQGVDEVLSLLRALGTTDLSRLVRAELLPTLQATITRPYNAGASSVSPLLRDAAAVMGGRHRESTTIYFRSATIRPRSIAVYAYKVRDDFRGHILVIPVACAGEGIIVRDVRVGGKSQTIGAIRAARFDDSHPHVENMLLETAFPGSEIELEIMNSTDTPVPFRARLVGITSGQGSHEDRDGADQLVRRFQPDAFLDELRQTPSWFYYWRVRGTPTREVAQGVFSALKPDFALVDSVNSEAPVTLFTP